MRNELIEAVAAEMNRLGYGYHESHAESIVLAMAKAAPVAEREAFEAHVRIGGYSNPDKHPDGSYVSSVMELWWQGWKARAAYQRAQQPQSAEAVAWHTEDHLEDKSATTYSKEIADRWAAKGWPVTPMFYTTPQPSAGVVVPERMTYQSGLTGTNAGYNKRYVDAWNACLDEFARLNGKEVGRG